MKKVLLFLLYIISFSLSPVKLSAQKIDWLEGSSQSIVYKISEKQAKKVLSKRLSPKKYTKLLTQAVDTININGGWNNHPDRGHYVLAKTQKNKLVCEYKGFFPYKVLLYKEYGVLSLQVLDGDGQIRKDAKVRLRSHRVAIDEETLTYRLDSRWISRENSIVRVELDGISSFFNIEKHSVSWSHNYHYDSGPDFFSYMLTDKNKYRPGDSVRFKSYALKSSQMPVRRNLDVWLSGRGINKKISEVERYRPGLLC